MKNRPGNEKPGMKDRNGNGNENSSHQYLRAPPPPPPPYTNNIIVPHLRQLREHGVRDDRYNLTKEC